jgi:hypothetical protein
MNNSGVIIPYLSLGNIIHMTKELIPYLSLLISGEKEVITA